MATGLHYNLNLPEDLPSILEHDFWMLENVSPLMFSSLTEPVKFAATTWIIVFQGSCKVDINLVQHNIDRPSLVCIKSSQIMQPKSFSSDFNAAFMVLSKRLSENLFLFLSGSPLSSMSTRHPVVEIPENLLSYFHDFIKSTRRIISRKDNPYGSQALIFHLLEFIHEYGYQCYEPFKDEVISRQGRMSDQFLALVQENFRRERFLDFYADKLEITPKHLSRTVKKQTGYTAVEWIERYVILEAKVLLKSSNLNIQQIADELNFPTQSFFGKYFKKITGQSPKEFRNS